LRESENDLYFFYSITKQIKTFKETKKQKQKTKNKDKNKIKNKNEQTNEHGKVLIE